MKARALMVAMVVPVVFVILVTAGAEEKKDPDKAQRYHKAGLEFYRGELYDEAIDAFRKAIDLDPDVAKYRFNLGICLEKSGDPTGAIEAYLEYAELAPRAEDVPQVLEKIAELRKQVKEKPEKEEAKVEAREGAKGGTCPDWMVSIPAGTFMMGSPSYEEGRDDDEGPIHEVRMSPFCMAKTEVTQAKWAEVMGGNPSHFSGCGGSCPVEQVSWFDAVRFCNELSSRDGLTPCYRISGESVTWDRSANGYRLPTEAEWEYACRAGTMTRFYTGNTEQDLSRAGWYDGNSGDRTHPVGEKARNAWGLYDMHGNVWEWCWDWLGPYGSGTVSDPEGPGGGSNRVLRGGSWNNLARSCRAAFRIRHEPGFRRASNGFRLSRSGGR